MFFWCHVRHLNPLKTHPERITELDKQMVNNLDYGDIKFLVSKKDYTKIERKNNTCINVIGYENGLVHPVHVLDVGFQDYMDLLLIVR